MLKEKIRKMKEIAEQEVKRAGRAMLPATVLSAACSIPVYASVSGVTDTIENLKSLIISIVSGVGVIILAYNIWNWAQAYQSHDNATMSQALKGIIGGLTMAAIGAVLTFLGY